jgi:hypothetical protein
VSIAHAGELRRGLSPRAKPELQSSIREDVTLPAVCQCMEVRILTSNACTINTYACLSICLCISVCLCLLMLLSTYAYLFVLMVFYVLLILLMHTYVCLSICLWIMTLVKEFSVGTTKYRGKGSV